MKSIGVLGLGAMGSLIASDLAKTYDGRIILLGRDLRKIKKCFRNKKFSFRHADVNDINSMAKSFLGINTIIHAVHHEYNLKVMNACLESGSNYIDLGGLFHYTKKQLGLNKKFKKKNLIAILGMGAAPGITNILAKYGSLSLKKINYVEIIIGTIDNSAYRQVSPLSNTYSLQTIFEEFTWEPAVYNNKRLIFIQPGSDRKEYNFPEPIGMQKPMSTIHSELATLPYTLNSRNVSFKIAFDDDFVNKILTLKDLGLISEKKLANLGITPKQASLAILNRLPKSIPEKISQYEIIRVILNKSLILDARIKGINETVDKDTAVPASIAAQMISNSLITKKGVFPPESIVPANEFFNELARRNIYIYKNNKRVI